MPISSFHAVRAGTALCAMLAAMAARAADIQLNIELPRFKHRPYVAVWIERQDRTHVGELALWHEGVKKSRKEGKKSKGDKYLPDLRNWWRTGGNALEAPIDGVSGPTRPAGMHELRFGAGQPPLGSLPAGSYRLLVEVSREDGGDEMLGFDLNWPPKAAKEQRQQGSKELGEVVLRLRP